jgi:hypothetical protein
MRWRWIASVFHGITLFACLNLVIPALFPDTRTLWSLLAAARIAVVSFWTLHVTRASAQTEECTIVIFVISRGLASGASRTPARGDPPRAHVRLVGGVGPKQLPDGRLAMEVKTLHPSVIQELIAVTDVVVPGGKGDRLRHVWRHDGRRGASHDRRDVAHRRAEGHRALRSSLTGRDLPTALLGAWRVDVETDDGQLVGRTEFQVVE